MNIIIILGTSYPRYESDARVSLAHKLFIEIYNDGKPVLVICSGGNSGSRKKSESYLMKCGLMLKGVPESLILEEPYSLNTIENILFSRQLISTLMKGELTLHDLRPDLAELHGPSLEPTNNKPLTLDRIAIVSSEYHLARVSEILKYFPIETNSVSYHGSIKYPPQRILAERNIMITFSSSLDGYKKFNPGDDSVKRTRLSNNMFVDKSGIEGHYKPVYT